MNPSTKFKEQNSNEEKMKKLNFFQRSIENLDLEIYQDKSMNNYKCIIREGNEIYESQDFTLQSKYEEGIIQDAIGEIGSHLFFHTFGAKTQHRIRKELLDLLERN